MRSVLGFFSLLAFGILAAGVLFVVASDPTAPAALHSDFTIGRIDLPSLLIGMVIGCLLSAMARISWSELPGRLAHFILHHERNFYRIAVAGALVAVLVYY